MISAMREERVTERVSVGQKEIHESEIDEAVEVETDNKGAHDLCHRYSAAQHSKHIDRKMYKMREMRGAKIVTVKYIPTGDNTADMWTKVLSRQPEFRARVRCKKDFNTLAALKYIFVHSLAAEEEYVAVFRDNAVDQPKLLQHRALRLRFHRRRDEWHPKEA